VFAEVFGNCNTHQCIMVQCLAVIVVNHTPENMMYVSVQQSETNTTKIKGFQYEHKCRDSSVLSAFGWWDWVEQPF
jgi:5,10-methylene-tetrahydrofolate dehydrogenase/methenyl tetrahydrofolate cyclohydrolase